MSQDKRARQKARRAAKREADAAAQARNARNRRLALVLTTASGVLGALVLAVGFWLLLVA